jgi:type I restriction enzyme, S subunit
MNNFKKLKDLCIKITDGSHYSPTGVDDGFPMLSVKDMIHSGFNYDNCKKISLKDYLELVRSDCKPKLNDVLIAKDGSYLKHVFVIKDEIDQAVLSSIGILRPNLSKVIPEYLKYFLHTESVKKTVAKKYVSGSALPRIIIKNFGEIDIVYKDIQSQKEIAMALTLLDNKIDVNNKINGELEGLAKLIYNYWFVQFDFPNEKGKPYKSSGGKMVYNNDLKQNIPEGWSAKNLNYFIATDKSGDWGKEQIEGNYTTRVNCIRGADINGINGKGEMKTPTRFILEKNEHKLLVPNDLVIEISGGSPTQSTGRLACITSEVSQRFENPLICSNFCKAVSLIAEEVVFYFTHSWNRAYDNGVFFGFEGKTSGIKNLLFDSLVSHYQIPFPDKNLLVQFQETVSLFEKQKQTNLKQNQELAALRDWLLPMLMNGQVKVGAAVDEVNKTLTKKETTIII